MKHSLPAACILSGRGPTAMQEGMVVGALNPAGRILSTPAPEAARVMPDGVPSPDEELMWQVQRGDREAFDELVRRHHRRIYGWAYRFAGRVETAEEWTQEVLLRIYERRASYDPSRPFAAWLRRVTANYCLNAVEARQEAPLSLDEMQEKEGWEWDYPDPAPLPEEILARGETREQVRNAIRCLPPPYRAVLLLRYFDELSYDHIAETLELPLGTVKTHLHRAKAALRRALEDIQWENEGWRPS